MSSSVTPTRPEPIDTNVFDEPSFPSAFSDQTNQSNESLDPITSLLRRLEVENHSLAADPKSVRLETGSVIARGTLLRRMRQEKSHSLVNAANKKRETFMDDVELEKPLSPRSDNHLLVPDPEKLKAMQQEEIDFWERFLNCHGGTLPPIDSPILPSGPQEADEILYEAYERLRNPATIPSALNGLRNKVWLHLLSISPSSLEPGGQWHTTYQSCLHSPDPDDSTERIILRDVPRTFAGWTFFKDGGLTLETFNQPQHQLYDVLRAYSKYDPEVGYCQGMSFVVAALLMMDFSPVESFAILTGLLHGFVPFLSSEPDVMTNRSLKKTYPLRLLYLPSMPGLHTLLHLVSHFLSKLLPRLSSHFDDLGVPVGVWASQWVLTLWTYSFPRRAWDHGWSRLLAQATDNLPTSSPTLSRSDRYTKDILGTTHDTLPGILLDIVLISLAYLKTAEDLLLEINDAELILIQLRGDRFFTKDDVMAQVHFQAEEWLRMGVISNSEIQSLRHGFEDTIVTLPRRTLRRDSKGRDSQHSDPLAAIPSPTLTSPVANSVFELQALVADLVQRNRSLTEKCAHLEAENELMKRGTDTDVLHTLAESKTQLALSFEERDRLNLRVRALTAELSTLREKASALKSNTTPEIIEPELSTDIDKSSLEVPQTHKRQGSFGIFSIFGRKTPEEAIPPPMTQEESFNSIPEEVKQESKPVDVIPVSDDLQPSPSGGWVSKLFSRQSTVPLPNVPDIKPPELPNDVSPTLPRE